MSLAWIKDVSVVSELLQPQQQQSPQDNISEDDIPKDILQEDATSSAHLSPFLLKLVWNGSSQINMNHWLLYPFKCNKKFKTMAKCPFRKKYTSSQDKDALQRDIDKNFDSVRMKCQICYREREEKMLYHCCGYVNSSCLGCALRCKFAEPDRHYKSWEMWDYYLQPQQNICYYLITNQNYQ